MYFNMFRIREEYDENDIFANFTENVKSNKEKIIILVFLQYIQ